jgi:hypothetical protein
MATIGQLIDKLRTTLDNITAARRSLRAAHDRLIEATTAFHRLLAGSTATESTQIVASLTSARNATTAELATLEQAAQHIQAYIDHLSPAASQPAETSPATGTTTVLPNQVETLRRELPPSITAGARGRKTHGRWIGPDGIPRPIVSGNDEMSANVARHLKGIGIPQMPAATTDVEMKLAAHMAQNRIRHTTVVINNSPCKGRLSCDTLVPILLPEGSTMTVHGVTKQGTPMRKTYTGGARPWWQ